MYYLDELEIESIRKVFQKGKLYRYHIDGLSECDLFEQEFSSQNDVSHSILLSSGTNALLTALVVSGIQPGDEVIVPAYTFAATATAVVLAGGVPVVANIDSNLGLCAKDVRAKITQKTKALIPVHMDGLSADLDPLLNLAKEKSLILIEDVAQAVGGSYFGKALGSLGQFGCFSLNENKIISCGEGGILTTKDPVLYEKAFCFHDGAAQFNPVRKEVFQNIQPFLGNSMRVSEIQGAIMRVQLSRLPGILNSLRQRKNIFKETLTGTAVKLIEGADPQGDCSTSLHLQFEEAPKAAEFGKKVREQGLLFAPASSRPAHAVWKWNHLLGERSGLQAERNPFSSNETKATYSTAEFLDSVDILSRTLKMDIDIHLCPKQTQDQAQIIRKVLTNV